eukprot:1745378-Pleurochrysis_carterae.AAC.1
MADLEARRSASVLLQKLQPEAQALANEQLKTAFKVLPAIKGKFPLSKVERRLLLQLLAPR